jgi:peptidoglycan/xylan/chitin deacetylase (PgdA/CDA1 family)
MKNLQVIILNLLILSVFSACAPQAQLVEKGEIDVTKTQSQSVLITQTPSATLRPTFTPTDTEIPTLTFTPMPTNTATITPTPYQLQTFKSGQIRSFVTIETYIPNTCEYLENRWGEGKSAPGTIVVPIMFHSIAKAGRVITDSTTISTAYFEYFMQKAQASGFSTITMDELVGFLEENKEIPTRSMILILDDRRQGVTELFMPYLEANDLTLTLGWPTTDNTSESLWQRMEDLAASGHLDVQSHGHDHIYIQGYTPLKEIEEEIYKPIEVIQAHFSTTPSAIIWPGGNFTDLSVSMAREAGLRLGFSVFSRGPLMYNWIPQGKEEMAVEDPLMVLPRFWSTTADVALDQAIRISETAMGHAESVKADELLYYTTYCQP